MSQVNVYDDAHRLARSIQGSQEYADYRLAAARLQGEKSSLEILRDFRRRQFALQAKALQGEELSEEERSQFADLSEIISSHAVIAAFLQAEYHLSRLLGDVQKIIADAVDVYLDFAEPSEEEPATPH